MVAAYLLHRSSLAEDVVLTPPLRAGASINLEMIVTRERTVAGRPPMKATATAPVRLEVLEVADDHTVIGWTPGKAELNDARLEQLMAEQFDPLLKLGADKTLELVLDEEFTPLSIRNVEQVIDTSRKAIDLIEQSLPDGETSAAAAAGVREMFANPDSLQTIMIQKPGRYFIVYGWQLEPGEIREEEMELPSPFGGEPLPATVFIELKPFKQDDAYFVVSYSQKLDQTGVQRVMRDAMQKFANDKFPADKQLPKLDVRDDGEFKISRATGWVEQARIQRTTSSDEGSQIETFEFRVVK
jgi:hypothetical protein